MVSKPSASSARCTGPLGISFDVGRPMARIRHQYAPAIRLNLLAAEPLAVAGLLGADTIVVIAEGNVPPSLAAAAVRAGIPVHTVTVR